MSEIKESSGMEFEEDDEAINIPQDAEETNGTAKRIRRPTEKGKTMLKDKQTREFIKTFKALERLCDDIRSMKESDSDLNLCRNKYTEWLQLYEQYLDISENLSLLIDPDEFVDLNMRAKDLYLTNFKVLTENWLISNECSGELENKRPGSDSDRVKSDYMEEADIHISASQISARSSRKSQKSDLSQIRLKQETKRAELNERMQRLHIMRDLEQEKLNIRLKEEELNLDTELAIVDAKARVLDRYEQSQCDENSELNSTLGKQSSRGSRSKVSKQSQRPSPVLFNPSAQPFIPSTSNIKTEQVCGEPLNHLNYDTAGQHYMGSDHVNVISGIKTEENCKPTVKDSTLQNIVRKKNVLTQGTEDNSRVETTAVYASGNEQSSILSDTLKSPDDPLMSVIRHLRKPPADIKKFGGNAMEYRKFLRQFNTRVVMNTVSYDERMNFLEQFTFGEANRIVTGYSHLDAKVGYTAALKELEDRYGDTEVIASAYVKRAMEWPPVKPDSAKALDDYAVFLSECENAVNSIEALKVIEYPEIMKRLVGKLPYRMHDRWRSMVHQTKENKQTVTFNQLVTFVKREAKKAIDPMYGREAIGSFFLEGKAAHIGRVQKGPGNRVKGSFSADVRDIKSDSQVKQNLIHSPLNSVSSQSGQKRDDPCSYCKVSTHQISTCWKFAALTFDNKIQFLKTKGACYGCLKVGHQKSSCHNKAKCTRCGWLHPTVLHNESYVQQSRSQTRADPQQTNTVTSCLNIGEVPCGASYMGAGKGVDCTMAIIPVKVKVKGSDKNVVTYAFMDTGSSANFITENLMNQLGVNGRKARITIDTMGKPFTMKTYVVTDLEVCDLDGEHTVNMPKVYTKDKMPVTKEHAPTQIDIDKWPHLQGVTIHDINSDVGLMIGNSVADAYTPLETVTGPPGSPHASRTRLGWIPWNVVREMDPVDTRQNSETMTVYRAGIIAIEHMEELKRLDQLVKESINLDFPERIINDQKENSQEDMKFIDKVNDSIKCMDGHYQIGLPFRREHVMLPNNREQAVQRLKHLKRKMLNDLQFRSDYATFMNDVIDRGYAKRVSDVMLRRDVGRVWYIPHHGVYHAKKPGKIRVVFDCAARFQGISLNDCLLQGPNLTNNLVGVLMRFRQEPIALMADIESMFHQVHVPEYDSDCLRFLWWPDGNVDSEPETFKMAVHLFGAVSSPSCANMALKRCADDNKDSYAPEVTSTIHNNFYVDDCLKSTENEEKAVTLVHELRGLCGRGGFNLTKWVSNSRTVLDSIPEEYRAKEVKNIDFEYDDLPVERALGVYWSVENDTFGFRITVQCKQPTKRAILSVISSVYDPLGLVAPCILPARIILQQLCLQNIGWDTDINDRELQIWHQWLAELPLLEGVGVSRCFKPPDFGDVISSQIHTFCDASEQGYGAVSYVRLINENGQIHTAIVMGKSRVAPLKRITIPRMELTAATVGVRLTAFILKELSIPVDESYYWTDSMSVLRYIRNESTRFHTFIANRIAVIRDASDVSQWNYIETKLNPADQASRGLTVRKFLQARSWFDGPEFLSRPQSEWPVQPLDMTLDPDDKEIKGVYATVTSTASPSENATDRLLHYFSDWRRLKRTVAWLLVGMRNLQSRVQARKSGLAQDTQKCSSAFLTTDDLNRAECSILRYVQHTHFGEVFQSRQDNSKKSECYLEKSSALRKLKPVVINGTLRVGGRLSLAHVPYEAKHQIILPKESAVSKLILYDIHRAVGHLGRNSILAKLRERYWIISASTLIKSIVSKCVICRKYQGRAGEQLMADLPADRLTPGEPPFSTTGVDYFGPIEVKRGRCIVKRYGVIFTCVAIRAVHIDVAYSLDTDSCINALRRFIARRGQVKVIRSDNGTNFVGAQRELRAEIDKWNQAKISEAMSARNVTWKFNPPSASHFGGIWERMIRTIRKILLKEQSVRLDDEALQTLLCEAESIINSRPITKLSNDGNDLDALTPNQLLLLDSAQSPPPGIFEKTDNYARRRWRQVQYLADIFWKRWTAEYLPMLQERQRWLLPKRNFMIGDIVLVVDNSAPRNSWIMGRVIEIRKDHKGLVRVVKLKTKSSVLERPVHKLCLILESDTEISRVCD